VSLPLTPEILRAAYDFLRTTPPFRSWRLPPGSEVEFHVLRTKQFEGDHAKYVRRDKHVVRVSAGKIGHSNSLLAVMGHEMIHMTQEIDKTYTPNTIHNKAFHRAAAIVCRYHGFDPQLFV